jgi:hypothetical protein
MKDVIIKDIKRKTSIPENVIERAVRIAYGVPTPNDLKVKPIRKNNTVELVKVN